MANPDRLDGGLIMLTKKTFEAVAAILESNTVPDVAQYAAGFDEGWATGMEEMRENIADELANYFATENPNFDREKFLNACGVA